MTFLQYVSEQISAARGEAFNARQQQTMAGGCINQAQLISDGDQQYFIKTNKRSMLAMFTSEAQALTEIAATQTVRVPQVIVAGEYAQQSFLVLENLPLGGRCNMAMLGQQLAAMHQVTQPQFGWHQENVIGSTQQINTPMNDWVLFWQQYRLGFQLSLAEKNAYGGELQKQGERLLADMAVLFKNYQPQPSLLHGDLWGGNAAGLTDGCPVIFDPALYYGDREADIAMTELFGGFSSDFYAAYKEAWPLDDGYKVRKTFYNIYHIINHLNLFGEGYYSQAVNMINRVLAEI